MKENKRFTKKKKKCRVNFLLLTIFTSTERFLIVDLLKSNQLVLRWDALRGYQGCLWRWPFLDLLHFSKFALKFNILFHDPFPIAPV